MSLSQPGATPPYIITRTRLRSPVYDGAVGSVLEALGICTMEQWKCSDDGLVVLRSTVMDPFAAEPSPASDHVTGFVSALRGVCEVLARRDSLLTNWRPSENVHR